MMTIRGASLPDAQSIAEVQVATWHTTYTGLMPQAMLDELSVPERTAQWTDILSKQTTVTHVLEHKGSVVGFINFGPARDEDKDPAQTGEVLAIYVYKEQQGKGFGKALFNKAHRHFLDNGFSEYVLWVLESNNKSKAFYQKMGLSPDGTTKIEQTPSGSLTELRYTTSLQSS